MNEIITNFILFSYSALKREFGAAVATRSSFFPNVENVDKSTRCSDPMRFTTIIYPSLPAVYSLAMMIIQINLQDE